MFCSHVEKLREVDNKLFKNDALETADKDALPVISFTAVRYLFLPSCPTFSVISNDALLTAPQRLKEMIIGVLICWKIDSRRSVGNSRAPDLEGNERVDGKSQPPFWPE